MKIVNIHVKNFKSLEEVPIHFDDLTVFVGKNNSGKSNIFDLLNFIKESYEVNIKEAYNTRGGLKDIVYGKIGSKEIEITITMSVPEEERKRIIGRCVGIQGNDRKEPLIKSHFLESMTYYITIGQNKMNERLEIANTESGDFVVRRIDGTISDYTYADNNLLFACSKGSYEKNLSQEMNESSRGRVDSRRLLCQAGAIAVPPSPADMIIALLTEEFSTNYVWISPIRKSEDKQGFAGKHSLDPEGRDLVNVLLTLHNNDHEKYQEIVEDTKSIVPEVEDILTPLSENLARVTVKESNFPAFTLENLSSGIKESLILITKVATAPKNSVVCIEEPEIHFHPSAQRHLFDFFRKQSKEKMVLITTHSPVFVSMAKLTNLRLVSKNSNGNTIVEQVTEENINRVISELGVKPSDVFDNDVAVFVDGSSDEGIFNEFANKLGMTLKVAFIGTESWNNTVYYANAKILSSKKIAIPLFVIFDGDTEKDERNRKAKQGMINRLNMEEHNILTLEKHSVESYLLIPRAIKKAFMGLKQSEREIEDFFEERKDKKNKKYVLNSLFKEGGLGKYNEKYGIKIAQIMNANEIDDEIVHILKMIEKTAM